MKTTLIELPISINYVSHWGFWQGIRELLQNAIDTKDYKVIESPRDNLIKIISHGGLLTLKSLMLGESTKRDDDSSIGKYGGGESAERRRSEQWLHA